MKFNMMQMGNATTKVRMLGKDGEHCYFRIPGCPADLSLRGIADAIRRDGKDVTVRFHPRRIQWDGQTVMERARCELSAIDLAEMLEEVAAMV